MITVAAIVSSGAHLQSQTLPEQAIALAKSTSAAELDSLLPSVPFPEWLTEVVGPSVKLVWELSDCGEQTGNPADSLRDFPYCVDVYAVLPDRREVGIMVAVGTFQRGLVGSPSVFSAFVVENERLRQFGRLSDLAQALRREETP